MALHSLAGQIKGAIKNSKINILKDKIILKDDMFQEMKCVLLFLLNFCCFFLFFFVLPLVR